MYLMVLFLLFFLFKQDRYILHSNKMLVYGYLSSEFKGLSRRPHMTFQMNLCEILCVHSGRDRKIRGMTLFLSSQFVSNN